MAAKAPPSDWPLSDVKRSDDDVLIRDVPQPYLDLADVLDRDLFDRLYEGFRQAFKESSGAELGPFFRDNPSRVVASFLQYRLEPKGYTLDDVNELVSEARANGESVSFDIRDLEEDGELGDLDYWPNIDLEAAGDRIAEFWRGVNEEAGGPKYYPGWLVRRQVAANVVPEAAAARPDLDNELATAWESIGLGEDNFFDEDERIDERLDAFLDQHHLGQIVDAFVQRLADGQY